MTVPSNLIPFRITDLPLDPSPSVTGILMYVRDGNSYQVTADEIVSVSGVPLTRQVNAGTGLTGGGPLSNNVTISVAQGGIGTTELAASGVTPGVYGSSTAIPVLTIDSTGRVMAATTSALSVSGFVPTTRQVIAGTGLNGGGQLTSNVTLNANLSNATPQPIDTTGSAGVSTDISRADHKHPAIDLADDDQVDGLLGLSNGGTARSLTPQPGAIIWSGSDGLYVGPAGSIGQVLVSGGTGQYTWGTALVIAPVAANLVYAGPASGPDSNSSFRLLVNADIPATLNGKTLESAVITNAQSFTAVSGNITTLTGSSWTVTNLTATSATISNFTFTSSTVTDLTATRLTATSAHITTLSSGSATLTNLTSTSGTISTLKSTSADITNLAVSSLTVSSLSLTNATFTSATITTLTSTSAGITTLSSGSLTATNLTATSGTVSTLTSTSAGITNLSVSSLTVSSLSLSNATFTSATITTLTSTSAGITTLTSGSGTLTNLTATSGTVTTLASTSASITNLSVSSLTVSSLSLSNATFTSATITTLTSTSAGITTLSSGSATLTNLTSTSGTVSTLTSISASVTNLSLGSLVISSSTLVTNLNADLLDGQSGSYYLDLANATGTLSGGAY